MTDYFGRLPVEIWELIAGHISSPADWASFARTSRTHHHSFRHYAYECYAPSVQRPELLICWAALHGFTRVIELAHGAGISVDAPVWLQPSATTGSDFRLHEQVAYNHWSPPKGIIRGEGRQCYPLHLAVMAGHLDVVVQLLEMGATAAAPSHGVCPCSLHKRYFAGRPGGGKWFVDHSRSSQWTALHVALCSGRLAIAQLLLAHEPALPLSRDIRLETTALHAACVSGDVDVIRWLVRTGRAATTPSQLEEEDWKGHTPLMYAAMYDRVELFQSLVSELGADVTKMLARMGDETGRGAVILRDAISRGAFRLALFLLDQPGIQTEGALELLSVCLWEEEDDDHDGKPPPPYTSSISQSDSDGESHARSSTAVVSKAELGGRIFDRLHALHPPTQKVLDGCLGYAAWRRCIPAMAVFLRAGADMDSFSAWSAGVERAPPGTPLLRAIHRSHEPRRTRYTRRGVLAEDMAATAVLDVVTWLLEHGADPNLAAKFEPPPLMLMYREARRGQWDKESEGESEARTREYTMIARRLAEFGAHPHRGTSGQVSWHDSRHPYDKGPVTPLEMALGAKMVEDFDYFVEARHGVHPWRLSEDDLIGLWRLAPRGDEATLRRLLSLDEDGFIARHCPTVLEDVLCIRPMPTDLVRWLLRHDHLIRRLQPSDVGRAMDQHAEPSLVRHMVDLIPDGPDKERNIRQVVFGKLDAIRARFTWLRTPTQGGGKADAGADEGYDLVGAITTILDAGISAYKTPGEDEHHMFSHLASTEERNPNILRRAIREGMPRLAVAILEKQPMRDQHGIDPLRYVEDCLLSGDVVSLRAVVASMDDGGSVIGPHAGWLSLCILERVGGFHTTTRLTAWIDCLEYLYGLGRGVQPVFAEPSATPSDQPPEDGQDADELRGERADRTRRARERLLRLMDLDACDITCQWQLGITWMLRDRITYNGQGDPVFRIPSFTPTTRDEMESIPWVMDMYRGD